MVVLHGASEAPWVATGHGLHRSPDGLADPNQLISAVNWDVLGIRHLYTQGGIGLRGRLYLLPHGDPWREGGVSDERPNCAFGREHRQSKVMEVESEQILSGGVVAHDLFDVANVMVGVLRPVVCLEPTSPLRHPGAPRQYF